MTPDADGMTKWWAANFKGEPVPYQLRDSERERWVRVHSLPGSKRYPNTEQEMSEVLHRYRAVIDRLLDRPEQLTVVIGRSTWPDLPAEQPSDPPGLRLWRDTTADHDPLVPDEAPLQLRCWFTTLGRDDLAVDGLLRAIASDVMPQNVLITCPPLGAVVHPYDGGADLIARDVPERDALSAEFSEWLPLTESGL